MSNLTIFEFESKKVRVIDKNGEPWFVAKDLCNILEIKNVSDSLSRLDDDEKGIDRIYTLGGKQDVAIVSESGMYALARDYQIGFRQRDGYTKAKCVVKAISVN